MKQNYYSVYSYIYLSTTFLAWYKMALGTCINYNEKRHEQHRKLSSRIRDDDGVVENFNGWPV